MVDHRDLAGKFRAVDVQAEGRVAHFNLAGVNFAEGNAAQVIAVIQVGDEHLETLTGVGAGRRDVFDDRVEERLHGAGDVLQFDLGVTVFGAGVDNGEIHLLVGGIKRNEQLPDQVEHLLRVGVVAVNLVDHHDRLGTGFESLAEHEARLRLRAVGGVHHQEHAVNHVHDALDLAAEVGVAGSVHDVDVVVLVFERGVLGADGDAFLALEVHGVHEAFLRGLVLVEAERPRLL